MAKHKRFPPFRKGVSAKERGTQWLKDRDAYFKDPQAFLAAQAVSLAPVVIPEEEKPVEEPIKELAAPEKKTLLGWVKEKLWGRRAARWT